jgi:NhaA family Na+:H+ antiporter
MAIAPTRRALVRLGYTDARSLSEVLRTETLGGVLMLAAAMVALVWANTPYAASYEALRSFEIGPASLHLDLSLQTWAADGLLAVFFFVAGLELKRELAVGSLRRPAQAAVPIAAAVAGMAVPALVFVAVAWATGGDPMTLQGWAIPTATDIAFALAVLAVIQSHCPVQLRAFLLTLAVADDLGAILVIAVFYTASVEFLALLGAVALLVAYWLLQRRRIGAWWLYVLIALGTWALVHESGVHATVAGMALALLTRARPDRGEFHAPAERFRHRLEPFSAGFAVPVFALLAAGVPASPDALVAVLDEPAALGVIAGLVLGKPLGVFLGAYLTARFTRARLDDDLAWSDIVAVGMLAGVGFTVSLLITELAYDADELVATVKAGVLGGSLLAAVIAAVLLARRDGVYRRRALQNQTHEDPLGAPVADPGPAP